MNALIFIIGYLGIATYVGSWGRRHVYVWIADCLLIPISFPQILNLKF
jgi:hypothetical protein